MERGESVEGIRFEPLDEWFFPTGSVGRSVISAPPEAWKKYFEMRDGWLANHPKMKEIPEVRLHPVEEEGRIGYVVQIGIVYPPSESSEDWDEEV